MSGSYLDINDILASQQKVQCVFETDIPALGNLSNNHADIAKRSKMELPLWLAHSLVNCRSGRAVSVKPPPAFTSSYREVLAADAHVVNLRKLNPHFYSFGTMLLADNSANADVLSRTLVECFLSRFRWLYDEAMFSVNREVPNKLEKQERDLYTAGQDSLKAQLSWESRQSEKMGPNPMVAHHRKRKVAEIQ